MPSREPLAGAFRRAVPAFLAAEQRVVSDPELVAGVPSALSRERVDALAVARVEAEQSALRGADSLSPWVALAFILGALALAST